MLKNVKLEIDGVEYKLELATDGNPCLSCAIGEECVKGTFFCNDCFDLHWVKLNSKLK